jgi:serine/threonine-protein kinase
VFQPTQGTLILGRYLLEHELARGGMSYVWVAGDMKLQRSVAVKLLGGAAGVNGDVCARFEREAMAVAQLQSPHVVQIFDYGVEHGWPIIVMERLYGEDLRSRLKRERRLSLAQVARIVVDTAKGLSEAHSAGIVHRDLKPGNIFFARSRQDEVVKLLDFGVAKAMSGSAIGEGPASLGGLVGTPHYMSPEQARGSEDIDHRSDLWALGVIIYNALTGRLPYGGMHTADVLAKIGSERFALPSAVCRDLPPELDSFMLQALAREPSERFSNAREMSGAFTRIVPVTGAATVELFDLAADDDDDDEKTAIYDASADIERAGLPRPPPLPAEFANTPSDVPSFPTYPSGTLGSALLDGQPRPSYSPNRKLVVWSLASLLVAGVAASAGVLAWSPSEDDQPVTVPAPAASAASIPEGDEESAVDAEETKATDAESEPTGDETPAPPPIAQPQPVSAATPTPRPRPKPIARPTPKPKPPEPAPEKKVEPKPASTDDWSTSRF